MKKFLLTAALILSLVVSLTAGTMAAYSQQVATLSTTSTTKQFNIVANANDQASFGENHKIAPGDRIVKVITLTNEGEVPATIAVDSQLTDVNNLPRLKFSCLRTDEKKAEEVIPVGGKATYTVTIEWPYGAGVEDLASAYAGKTIGYTFNAKATSVDQNKTNDK